MKTKADLYKHWMAISNELGKLYAAKPSPLRKACGVLQPPECDAKHTKAMREYNSAAAKLCKELTQIKKDLETAR